MAGYALRANPPYGLRNSVSPCRPGTHRRIEVDRRPERHDSRRIDGGMAHVVVALDVGEIHGLAYPGPLVEVARVGKEIAVVDEPADVALEVADVDRVEADQGGEEAQVR